MHPDPASCRTVNGQILEDPASREVTVVDIVRGRDEVHFLDEPDLAGAVREAPILLLDHSGIIPFIGLPASS